VTRTLVHGQLEPGSRVGCGGAFADGVGEPENRAVRFISGEAHLATKNFFSEQFHGICTDTPSGLCLCAEIALKYSSGDSCSNATRGRPV